MRLIKKFWNLLIVKSQEHSYKFTIENNLLVMYFSF
jgi:hypothetical protein